MHLAPLDQLIGKTIVIFGLGAEGRSTFEFVKKAGFENQIVLVDDKPLEDLDKFWQQSTTKPLVRFQSSSELLAEREAATTLLFKTPGIPANHPFVTNALQHGAQLLSNTQLFFELVNAYNATQDARILITIGVTGTKGKSTTTSLIHHLLETANLPAFLGGNIGKPALELWHTWEQQGAQPTYFVLELSAHQLAELPYSPHIAVVQAITPEHLDYYQTMDAYVKAKSSIAQYQTTDDVVLFNADSPTARAIADLSNGQKLGFGLENPNSEAGLQDLQGLTIPLAGRHNLYNVLPAILLAQVLEIDREILAQAVASFQALPHRLQLVAEVNGVQYIDDSIATTPEAAIAALQAFPDKSIILIAGGHDRHLNYTELAHAIVEHNVKAVALFPDTGFFLKQSLEALQPRRMPALNIVNSMDEAIAFAQLCSSPGDIVLLSPAAASFGMFKDYRDRGDQFTAAVEKLIDTPSSV